MGATIDIPTFAATQLTLLAAELAAETATSTTLLSQASPTTLSRLGLAILNLTIASQRTGLGGKTVLELEQHSSIGGDGKIGEHDVGVGDIVKIAPQPKGSEKKREKASLEEKGVSGVVVRAGERGVQVALDRDEVEEEGLGGRLWM